MYRGCLAGALTALVLVPPIADVWITRTEFTKVESPTFEGKEFDAVGTYEKLVGHPPQLTSVDSEYHVEGGYLVGTVRYNMSQPFFLSC